MEREQITWQGPRLKNSHVKVPIAGEDRAIALLLLYQGERGLGCISIHECALHSKVAGKSRAFCASVFLTAKKG